MKYFITFDIGAESGRGIIGKFDGKKISLEVIHRFPNGPISVLGTLYWDIFKIFDEIKKSLQLINQNYKEIESIGIDTWGVDFGLLDKNGTLLGYPVHYRDKRTEGMYDEAFKRMTKREIFENTGIQFMQINTIYQLLSLVIKKSPILQIADKFLTIPDLLNYFLTGVKVAEFTNATTTQLFDPNKRQWSKIILEKMEIPQNIMPEIIKPGTKIGKLLSDISREIGIPTISVIAPACHDTGSAVAGIPGKGENWAYISSGTWSLMGAEIPKPLINEKALEYNFTNEGGVENTFRFLKNIMGLWLLQECRRIWEKEGVSLTYSQIVEIGEKSQPFSCFIDPDNPCFLNPENMPKAIQDFCRKTNQKVPEDKSSIIRCILESLSLKYRYVFDCLSNILNKKFEILHIVGGGSQNKLLCQMTANACKIPVMTGPVEATAVGNVLMQLLATRNISSLSEGREIIKNSFETEILEPKDTDIWEEAYDKFLKIIL